MGRKLTVDGVDIFTIVDDNQHVPAGRECPLISRQFGSIGNRERFLPL